MTVSTLQTCWFGQADHPAVVTVGTWDPLLAVHEDTLRRQSQYARRSGFSSVAVLLDPNPARFVSNDPRWPAFADVAARRFLMRHAEIDGILQVDFRRNDLLLGAKELLQALNKYCQIAELWLGKSQTLGRGTLGNDAAICELARERHFTVRRLEQNPAERLSSHIRQSLLAGDIRSAACLAGRAPQWSRPSDDVLRLGWHPGTYQAVPMRAFHHAARSTFTSDICTEVELTRGPHGLGILRWPRQHDILAFTGGPNDGSRAGWRTHHGAARSRFDDHQVRVTLRALADPVFRAQLKADPRAALERQGVPADLVASLQKNLIVDGVTLHSESDHHSGEKKGV